MSVNSTQSISSAKNAGTRLQKAATVLRVTSGNFLEQFDFFLFGFYAPSISKAFFPTSSEYASLMLAFTVFGVGFLMRPLGAIFLGSYIDKVGRRSGLIATLTIMASGTIMIACTPDYKTIGFLAPIFVLLGRLLQGFSAGAELGGVSVYLAEMTTPKHTGFYTSWQSASQQVAIVVAASLGYGLNHCLTTQQMDAWGWRIPFFIGCLIIPFLFILRKSLQETAAFKARHHHLQVRESYAILLANWKLVIAGMLITSMTTTTFYFITVYTPTFGRAVLNLSTSDSLIVTLLVGISNFFWLPIGGAISDRIGRKRVLLTITTLTIYSSYPALFWLVSEPSFFRMLAVLLLFSFFFGIYNGTMVAALTEVMPVEVRVTGFSLAFSLATAIFGGFTPAMSTYLVKLTHDKAAPAYWLSLAATCAFWAALWLYKRRKSI